MEVELDAASNDNSNHPFTVAIGIPHWICPNQPPALHISVGP